MWIRYEPVLDSWTGPFLMAGINTRVVRRSNMLQGYDYGRDFTYKEVTATGPGWADAPVQRLAAAPPAARSHCPSGRPVRSLRVSCPNPVRGPAKRPRRRVASGSSSAAPSRRAGVRRRGDREGRPGLRSDLAHAGESGCAWTTDGPVGVSPRPAPWATRWSSACARRA